MEALILLLGAALAGEPLTWWAPTPEEAARVEAALAALWPEGGVAVQVGEPPAEGDRIASADVGLTAVLDGLERASDVADPALQVALVRSWAGQRLPPPAPPPPAPIPEPPDEEPLTISLFTGFASRHPGPEAVLHLSGQARWGRGPVGATLAIDYDPGERIDLYEVDGSYMHPARVRRLGALAGVAAEGALGPSWSLEGGLEVGYRLHAVAVYATVGSAVSGTPTAAARLHAWRAGGGWQPGLGAMVSVDGLEPDPRYAYDGLAGQRRPVTAALEVGVRRP